MMSTAARLGAADRQRALGGRSGPNLSRRRVGAGFAAAAAAGVLAACGGQGRQEQPAARATAPVTVTFMASGNQTEQQMYQESLDVFAKKQTAIKPDFQVMPPGGWPKTMAMLMAGDAPDVFRVDDDSVYYLALGGLALHLDPYIKQHMKRGDYYPLLFETLAVEGKNYCLNPCMGANVLYYNADLFREAGITNVPRDWKQAVDWTTWVDWLGRLAKKRGNELDVAAVAYPMNMITAMAYSNDAPPFNADETRCLMDSTPALEVVQDWADLTLRSQVAAPPTANRMQLFNQKKLAVMWESMSVVPGIATDVTWDVMPMPKGKKKAVTENYVRSFIVPSFTKVPEQAFLTLKHFLDKEGQEIVSRYDWGVPFLKSVADGPVFLDPARPPRTRRIWTQTLEPGWDAPLPLNPASYWFKQIFTDRHMGFGLQDTLEGKVTVREFLEEGTRQVNRHLQEMAWKKGKKVTAEEWKP